MIRLLTVLLPAVLFSGYLVAQPPMPMPSYTVSSSKFGSYADLTGATAVNLGDDAISSAISPPGFNFYYFGSTYTSFKIGSNGYIVMGGTGTTTSSVPDHTTAPGQVIAPLWCDLWPNGANDFIGYKFQNGVLTVEWRDVYAHYSGPASFTPAVRMQVVLDMASSKIAFRYADPNAFQSLGATTTENYAVAISAPVGSSQPTVVGAVPGYVAAQGAVTKYPEEIEILFSPTVFDPYILSSPTTAATVGQAYTYDVIATGNPAPGLSATGLPSWLSFTGNRLAGTPGSSNIGTSSTITITAQSVMGMVQQAFSITVGAQPSAPVITSAAPTTALVGSAYSYTVTASGNPTPTFSASGLPAWLTLSGDTLGGMPGAGDVGSTGAMTITASNSSGTDQQQFTITVSATAVAPAITSTPVTSVLVGASYTYSVVAGGNPPPSVTFSGQPSWLGVAGNTLSGTPGTGDIGTSGTITVTATNSAGTDQQTFTITVSAPPPAPIGGSGGGGGSGGCSAAVGGAALPLLLLLVMFRRRRRDQAAA